MLLFLQKGVVYRFICKQSTSGLFTPTFTSGTYVWPWNSPIMLLSAFLALVITNAKALKHNRTCDIRSKVRSGYRSILATGLRSQRANWAVGVFSSLHATTFQIAIIPFFLLLLWREVCYRNWAGFWYQSISQSVQMLHCSFLWTVINQWDLSAWQLFLAIMGFLFQSVCCMHSSSPDRRAPEIQTSQHMVCTFTSTSQNILHSVLLSNII